MGAPTGLSRTQRFVTRLVGPETAAAMEAHSRAWLLRCPHCGHERSVWDLGGIRYQAVGESRNLLRCPACGRSGWHRLSKSADFPVTHAPALPLVRLIIVTIVAILALSALAVAVILKLVGVW